MAIKLFDSELKIMNILWKEEQMTAKQLSLILKEQVGWNKNTTYTVIKKCIDKGAIERIEPNFVCRAVVPKEEIQMQETVELIDKMFDGSTELLFASLLSSKRLEPEKLEKLKSLIEECDKEV